MKRHTSRTLLVALSSMVFTNALAQLAPTGSHYAGRPSDTGHGGTFVSATGTLGATIPLDLPPARNGLPMPFEIAYGAHRVGAAGLGWDVPLSYIQHGSTLAYRRSASVAGALPSLRERTSLTLLGQTTELMRDGAAWVARSGTLELTVRQSDNANAWLAYDGQGRTYQFTHPTELGYTGLWLLESVTAPGGAQIQLTYDVSRSVTGGSETSIDLVGIDYNMQPRGPGAAGCAKNEVSLSYNYSSGVPLSLSVFDDTLLVRQRLLTDVDVRSRATCATPYESLRRYHLQYAPDADTQMPRLRSVEMYGRQGAAPPLPIGIYGYGSATDNGALRYKMTQTIELPQNAQQDQISGTTQVVPAIPFVYAMWQDFIDITGDGRPDLLFKIQDVNQIDQVWAATNRAAADGSTTIALNPQSWDLVTTNAMTIHPPRALALHDSFKQRYQYELTGYRNTVDVWRLAMDVNGDGRVDLIDAHEEPHRWVVYLNTRMDANRVVWERRTIDITPLAEELASNGHAVGGDFLPLSRRATGTDVKGPQCWIYDGTNWHWYVLGLATGKCAGGVLSDRPTGPERTFVEWELMDLNGDGYPDFVFNTLPTDAYAAIPMNVQNLYAGRIWPTPGEISADLNKFDKDFGPGPRAPGPSPHNDVRASFNVVGVRFDSDLAAFSRSVSLFPGTAGGLTPGEALVVEAGVSEWVCGGPGATNKCDDKNQWQLVGFADVNGDGLMDRVVNGGRALPQALGAAHAYLGMYSGTAVSFSPVYLTMPGPLALVQNTHDQQCARGGGGAPESNQTKGLRDLTGDGIPDYYEDVTQENARRVWIGTGTGFRSPIEIDGTFVFSDQNEECGGSYSLTKAGLYDIDGDGQPDVIRVINGQMTVWQLTGDQGPGRPDAGRLTEIDNGYGAKTSIKYVSAKRFTDNWVPFPENVVSSVSTTGAEKLGGALAGTLHAYGGAQMVFDSELDRFTFPGYQRHVEVRLFGSQETSVTGRPAPSGDATITDAWGLTVCYSYPPDCGELIGTEPEKQQKRWLRTARVGRIKDVLGLRGLVNSRDPALPPDPWGLLSVTEDNPLVIGATHYNYDAKLYQAPKSLTENVLDCMEMLFPFDYRESFASNFGQNYIDACRFHGFAFVSSTDSWRGDAAPPSDQNVQTRTLALKVDDFGRPLITEYDNDVFRGDDDICVENTFAKPTGTFPRVLNALASQRFFLGARQSGLGGCGAAGELPDVTFASESWTYDGLAAGAVSNGWATSHSVDRRTTDTGKLLNTVRKFDVTYDAAGTPISVRTHRPPRLHQGAATRTVHFDWDPFELVPVHTRISATGVPPIDLAVEYDPVSLLPLSSTDSNHVRRGLDLDGFDRPVRSTLTLPGTNLGVMAIVSYSGFAGADLQGRRFTVTEFSDPIAPAAVATTPGRSWTQFLDELGRTRRTELALGSDYANQVLVVGSRLYDGAGRLQFEADPYPSSQDLATAYGTTYYYGDADDLQCAIRGSGRQPLSFATDVASERFPTCFERSFGGHVDTLDMRDAASLQAGSPQAGVVRRVVGTAIGRVIERSAWLVGTRLEDATFAYDPLGQLTSMTRFQDAANAKAGVSWLRQVDSIGETLGLTEPDAPVRSYRHSDWGELIETEWLDGGTDRRMISTYDAAGRVRRVEERNNGITDPQTVMTYDYDVGVPLSPLVTPAFVLGRLARASSPRGQVAFSYDALGRVNAQVYSDDLGLYVQRVKQHTDGSVDSVMFNLPDQNYRQELAAYSYDSAGRLREVDYTDPTGTRQLYHADNIDVWGRLRKALYPGNTAFQASYADQGRRLIQEAGIASPLGSRRIVFGTFDPLGRELSRTEFTNRATNGRHTDSSYDQLGQLATATQTSGASTLFAWHFGYDPLGNIGSLTDSAHQAANVFLGYQTNDSDRLCRIDYGLANPPPAPPCNVTNDRTGNVVSEPTRTGSRQFTYFSSGDVRTITEGSAQATFAYDPFGQAERLDIQGTPAQQRHDRRYGGLIQRREITSAGNTTSLLLRSIPGTGGVVATRRGPGGDWVFEFGELRGNRFFTNQDGALVQQVDYQPYGEAKSTGASANTPDYTSYQWNRGDALAPFGLSHLGARIYDPVIGRFMGRDPILAPRTAATSNPYAFAANDPLNFGDPSGLDPTGSDPSCGPLCITKSLDPSVDQLVAAGVTVIPATADFLETIHWGHQSPQGDLLKSEVEQYLLIHGSGPPPPFFDYDAVVGTGISPELLGEEIADLPFVREGQNRWIERSQGSAERFWLGVAAVGLTGVAAIEIGGALVFTGRTVGAGLFAEAGFPEIAGVIGGGTAPTAGTIASGAGAGLGVVGIQTSPWVESDIVLVDSNAVVNIGRDPTLCGRILPGETPVVSFVTRPELEAVVARGEGLRGMPRALNNVDVLSQRPSLDTVINLRASGVTRGRFGDGIIGAQALEFGLPLITNDKQLTLRVWELGGTVRYGFQ
jgi:RHS repeat-associated protein